MPKCMKCLDFLPPNYTEIIPNSLPDSEGNYPQECIFCKLGVKEVERVEEKGSEKYIKYTKEQCKKDYFIFLNKLKNENVKKIMDRSEDLI